VTDDAKYLAIEIDRGVSAKRVDIVFRDLTKPASPFEVLVWGLESRFSANWVKGAWYVKTDYKSPKGRVLLGDPGVMRMCGRRLFRRRPTRLKTSRLWGTRFISSG